MNIQYRRNLKNSYMVVVEEGQPLNMDGQLAEKMMQKQRISGLLYWVTMEHEGDMTFWYQITGLQSLSDWLCHHPLDQKLFGHLLSTLLALQEELPRFYLKTEHLFLQMEQIFLDTSGEQVAFCYEPLWNKEPQRALQELMEQLLPKIDHTDKEAVRFGYGLYEKCQETNADVWKYVMEHVTGKVLEENCVEEMVLPEQPVQEMPVSRPVETTVRTKRSILPAEMFEKLPTSSAIAWIGSVRDSISEKKKKKEQHASHVYLFEAEETERECTDPTVFLGARETAEGRLLYQGTGAEQSFVIEGDSFLVGGENGQADGQLRAAGISRNHARITREENEYYIEDLNSRNGTYLNGTLLAYKQKCRMKPGDHLRFAREEYVFI